MNNLYDKIYEAIDTGIQKALIINNDQLQDISIGWHEKNMSTNTDMLNHYVRQLLSNSISDEDIKHYYCQITQFKAKNKKAAYKINNMHDLIQIFDNLYHIKLTKKCSLSWLDTFNIMSFIMSDNSELSLCDINNVNRTDVRYIKFQGFDNCGHPIIIHKDLLIKDYKGEDSRWIKKKHIKPYNDFDCINNQKLGLVGGLYTMQSNHDKMIKDASYDFNGYEHTYNNADIISNNRKLSNYPAIDYARQQSNGIMQCYLPATGELIEIIKISNVLNLILDLVLHVSKMDVNANYWSSTEYNNMLAWYLTMGTLSVTDKTDGAHMMVLPIFKKC